jgi:hypothetical protein
LGINSEKHNLNTYCLDQDCSTYIKKKSRTKFGPRLRRNWQLSEVVFAPKCIEIDKYFVTKHELQEEDITCETATIHFRGTDFAQWKAHAIIEPDFFLDALERYCASVKRINLVTDDPEHTNINEITTSLRSTGIQVSIFSGSQHSDFMRLLMSDWIIASPSTFSLSAAILGGRKIIYPKKYAEIEAKAGACFWKSCVRGDESAYVRIEIS